LKVRLGKVIVSFAQQSKERIGPAGLELPAGTKNKGKKPPPSLPHTHLFSIILDPGKVSYQQHYHREEVHLIQKL